MEGGSGREGEGLLSIHNRSLFLTSFAAVQIPGLISCIMMITWTANYRGGFAWGAEDPGKAFNWHPLLMTIGLIFLYGNGALVYRVFPPADLTAKFRLKLLHAATMLVVFVLTIVALQAAFDSHNLKNPPIPNMYTLHSWVGLSAVILFAAQWLSGLLVFLLPVVGPRIRSSLLPFHQYFGSCIFGLSVAAALMGILEKTIWVLPTYKNKEGEGLLVNCMGVMIILFAMGVTFLLSKFEKK